MERVLVIACMPLYAEKGSSLRAMKAIEVLSQKYEVDVVCYATGKENPREGVSFFRTPKFFKPNLRPFQISFFRIILDFFVLMRAFSLLCTRHYSVIHAEDFEAACIARVLVFFRLQKKMVYNLHNRISDNLGVSLKKDRGIFTFLLLRIEKSIIQKSDLIVCNWKRYQEDNDFALGKKILWYDSISLQEKEPFLPSYFPKHYLLYSGNTLGYQGVFEFLVQTQNASFALPLVIVGKVDEALRKNVSHLEREGKVFFLGEKTIEETNILIKKSFFCILPRLTVCSSMKVLHYFSNDKPVFAKNIPYNNECIVHEKNGILYDSPSELLAFYEKAVTNRSFYKSLSVGAAITGKNIRDNWLQNDFIQAYGNTIQK